MNYIIEYKALGKNGAVLASGKMKAKNKASSFEAQCSFEKHLKNKHKDFTRLIVISCKAENQFQDMFKGSNFDDLFKNFGEIFKP